MEYTRPAGGEADENKKKEKREGRGCRAFVARQWAESRRRPDAPRTAPRLRALQGPPRCRARTLRCLRLRGVRRGGDVGEGQERFSI